MIAIVDNKKADARNVQYEQILPQIRRQASIAFRDQPPELRDELISETIANTFVAFVRLIERGCGDLVYPTVLAKYAIKQVCEGRRVGGKLNIRDISSEHAQRAKGITIESIDRFNQRSSEWLEVLVEDKSASPADVAATRIDFAEWLDSLPPRQRQLATTLATGESTGTAAKIAGVSAARVSQLRRELQFLWDVFQGQAESQDVVAPHSPAKRHTSRKEGARQIVDKARELQIS